MVTGKVRIRGITRKMKCKVKEHGDVWEYKGQNGRGRILLSTLNPVHGSHPYAVWVTIGKDIEVVGEDSEANSG